ncbi:MAG: guanitoxin biosynthesis MBL fold metallo-hydrolase GntH, partial [Acidimicrobiia bacterium]
PTTREEIQNQGIRDSEIDPSEYYPDDYHPQLLLEWPVENDIVIPVEQMPADMYASMSQNWRHKQAYKKHISELTAEE